MTQTQQSRPLPYRLIVTDMDGTLLNDDKEVPDSFWPVVTQLLDKGLYFAPASGRQLATLQTQFESIADEIPIIAENGNLVAHNGEIVSVTSMDYDLVAKLVNAVNDLSEQRVQADRLPLSTIVCGQESAYVEFFPEHFGISKDQQQEQLAEASKYYLKLARVDDVLAAAREDNIVKIAVFDPYDVEEETAARLSEYIDDAPLRGVVSGAHWLDIIDANTNKGTALQALQKSLDVSAEETLCFVDYLNDLELLDHSGRSFAMANAHPDIKDRATDIAPANTEEGVVMVLKELFGLE